MEKDPFKEYLRESEPDKAGKGYACKIPSAQRQRQRKNKQFD